MDLHATGTPGDLNELNLVEPFVGSGTRITARKGQLGHGMSNSGRLGANGARAMSLTDRQAMPMPIPESAIHTRIKHPEAIVRELSPIDGMLA